MAAQRGDPGKLEMNWRRYSILGLALLALASILGSAAAGPNLPPAPNTALPVGTVLDYGWWKCVVKANDGFDMTCADRERRARIFGKFITHGEQDKDGYGGAIPEFPVMTSGANFYFEIDALSMSAEARRAMRALWPLAVGKRSSLVLKHGSDHPDERIEVKFEVTGTERETFAGRPRDVYVIRARSDVYHLGDGSRGAEPPPYSNVQTWWYDPREAIVVKSTLVWKDFAFSTSFGHAYALVKATFPEPSGTAESPAEAPVPEVALPAVAARPPVSLPPVPVPSLPRPSLPVPMPQDREPPSIDVPETVSTTGAVVEFVGRVRDSSEIIEVTVDAEPATIGTDGLLRVRRQVPQGRSIIVVAALDKWGNRSSQRITVMRKLVAVIPRPSPDAKPAASADNFEDIQFGDYYALVIGNNKYRKLTSLKTAVGDAKAVARVLTTRYGFNVRLLLNATRADMIGALTRLRAKLTVNDNLLIYYAGHGDLDKITRQGYWLPVDSDFDVPTNWVSNDDITVMIRGIGAKHIMVVADSCYSGTLVRSAQTKLRTAVARRAWLERISKKRTRTALVSGGLEPVLDSGGGDHSVFAKAFLDALRENRGVLEGQALFDAIKRPVVVNSDQTPEYSDIRRAGHDGGDFLFVRRK